MSNEYNRLDSLTRRHFVARAAKTCLGVSILPVVGSMAHAQSRANRAKQVIYFFNNGAMTHIDTFDPKPGSEVQGQTGVIQTAIPGVQFGEHFEGLSSMSDKLAVVRSMSTTTGAHGPGQYLMRTNYKPLATTRHPGIGPWMQKLAGRRSKVMPASVNIGGGAGPGYLGAQFAPVPIGDPNRGLQNTKAPAYLTEQSFDKRIALSRRFDSEFRKKAAKNSNVNGYDDLYGDTIGLLKSEELKAFNINQEPEEQRNAYGNSRLGRAALLARRLIENQVQFVEINTGGWDMHQSIFDNIPNRAGELDNAVTTLMKDLENKGMLNDTLIVIATEFGRKPKINQNAGRDHHPAAFSCCLAGGGIAGGQVYGSTDSDAFYPEDDPVDVHEFNATIAAALGLSPGQEIHSPDGRPFTLGHGAEPIQKLLA